MKEVEQFVLSHPSDNVAQIAKDAQERFNRFIPATTVSQIRAKSTRAQRVTRAKDAASSTLEDNVEIVEGMKSKLLSTFKQEELALKDRIEAAKELRQWVKLGIDMAGIHDEESDTLFVVDGAWNTMPNATN
jgi:hypothetical protein